jgi:hypothetical protein
MKIAVYCASSGAVAPENLTLGFDLGAEIARSGHELVWGWGELLSHGKLRKRRAKFGRQNYWRVFLNV